MLEVLVHLFVFAQYLFVYLVVDPVVLLSPPRL